MSRLIDADALKDWLEIVPLTGDGGVDINDLVKHIDSLPTVHPTPPNTPNTLKAMDCVSRQKAINTVERMFLVCDEGGKEEYRDLMVEALKDLPSAQPEPYKEVDT